MKNALSLLLCAIYSFSLSGQFILEQSYPCRINREYFEHFGTLHYCDNLEPGETLGIYDENHQQIFSIPLPAVEDAIQYTYSIFPALDSEGWTIRAMISYKLEGQNQGHVLDAMGNELLHFENQKLSLDETPGLMKKLKTSSDSITRFYDVHGLDIVHEFPFKTINRKKLEGDEEVFYTFVRPDTLLKIFHPDGTLWKDISLANPAYGVILPIRMDFSQYLLNTDTLFEVILIASNPETGNLDYFIVNENAEILLALNGASYEISEVYGSPDKLITFFEGYTNVYSMPVLVYEAGFFGPRVKRAYFPTYGLVYYYLDEGDKKIKLYNSEFDFLASINTPPNGWVIEQMTHISEQVIDPDEKLEMILEYQIPTGYRWIIAQEESPLYSVSYGGTMNVELSQLPLSAPRFLFSISSETDIYRYEIPVVSTTETTVTNGFSLYPNPAIEKINLDFAEAKKGAYLLLYNSRGQLIEQVLLQSGQNHLEWNLAHLPAGVYIIHYHNGKNRAGTKLIKQ